jgi:hypothetical protein
MGQINYEIKYFWIYALMSMSTFSVLPLPFIILSFVYMNRKNKKM